ncbi:hypothetical protein JVU11DRAFT_7783 [Chiua virens]|nr:hypothetical protein JVU11DRAFT_7783 [Chiua virens]
MEILQSINDQLVEYLGKPSLLHPDDLETPFSQFSALNIAPSPQDISFVDAIVSERHSQLSVLGLQIESVDSAIRKLADIRTKLDDNSAHVRESLLAHQALTSPALRIPPEVLGEVFYHCLPKTPYITPRDVECPMVLTRVCRHWRAVALSTPHLWSSFSIPLQKTACEEYRNGCEAWLARAKSIPLTIRILNDIIFDADPTLISSLALWLRPIITRCDDLWWHGPSLPALFTPEIQPEIETTPALPLEQLRVTTHRDILSIHLPGSAIRLRVASLQCLNYDLESLDGITLPWAHLTELHVHFALFSPTVFLQLLMGCTHLHTLIASCLSADDVQLGLLRGLASGSLTHPTLRRLEVKVIRAGLDELFNVLALPALEELDVCFCYRERDEWPHPAFMGMIRRSGCTLAKLTVRSNKRAVPYFDEYVKAMPGLAVSTSAIYPRRG